MWLPFVQTSAVSAQFSTATAEVGGQHLWRPSTCRKHIGLLRQPMAVWAKAHTDRGSLRLGLLCQPQLRRKPLPSLEGVAERTAFSFSNLAPPLQSSVTTVVWRVPARIPDGKQRPVCRLSGPTSGGSPLLSQADVNGQLHPPGCHRFTQRPLLRAPPSTASSFDGRRRDPRGRGGPGGDICGHTVSVYYWTK